MIKSIWLKYRGDLKTLYNEEKDSSFSKVTFNIFNITAKSRLLEIPKTISLNKINPTFIENSFDYENNTYRASGYDIFKNITTDHGNLLIDKIDTDLNLYFKEFNGFCSNMKNIVEDEKKQCLSAIKEKLIEYKSEQKTIIQTAWESIKGTRALIMFISLFLTMFGMKEHMSDVKSVFGGIAVIIIFMGCIKYLINKEKIITKETGEFNKIISDYIDQVFSELHASIRNKIEVSLEEQRNKENALLDRQKNYAKENLINTSPLVLQQVLKTELQKLREETENQKIQDVLFSELDSKKKNTFDSINQLIEVIRIDDNLNKYNKKGINELLLILRENISSIESIELLQKIDKSIDKIKHTNVFKIKMLLRDIRGLVKITGDEKLCKIVDDIKLNDLNASKCFSELNKLLNIPLRVLNSSNDKEIKELFIELSQRVGEYFEDPLEIPEISQVSQHLFIYSNQLSNTQVRQYSEMQRISLLKGLYDFIIDLLNVPKENNFINIVKVISLKEKINTEIEQNKTVFKNSERLVSLRIRPFVKKSYTELTKQVKRIQEIDNLQAMLPLVKKLPDIKNNNDVLLFLFKVKDIIVFECDLNRVSIEVLLQTISNNGFNLNCPPNETHTVKQYLLNCNDENIIDWAKKSDRPEIWDIIKDKAGVNRLSGANNG